MTPRALCANVGRGRQQARDRCAACPLGSPDPRHGRQDLQVFVEASDGAYAGKRPAPLFFLDRSAERPQHEEVVCKMLERRVADAVAEKLHAGRLVSYKRTVQALHDEGPLSGKLALVLLRVAATASGAALSCQDNQEKEVGQGREHKLEPQRACHQCH